MLLGMPMDNLLEEEDSFKRVLRQAGIEQALKLHEHFLKQHAILIANNLARILRR